MNRAYKALVGKDVRETTGNRQIFLAMVIVPLSIIIFIPTIFIIISYFAGNNYDMIKDLEKLLTMLPFDYKQYAPGQLLMLIVRDYMFPSFFLLIPIMAAGIIGASSFVGEREHKTMETLLYTPISMEQLLKAKILGVFIPAYIVTLLSFIGFGVVINIGGMLNFGHIIFPNLKWLIIILWVSPAVTLFSLTFTVLVSAKSSTFQEAQQVSGILVIPVILLLAGQLTGLFLLNNIVMVIFGAVLMAANYILVKKVAKKFVPEKLV